VTFREIGEAWLECANNVSEKEAESYRKLAAGITMREVYMQQIEALKKNPGVATD
jgi:hypothetical protein